MELRVIQGDIAAQSADALVNAAGTSLQMGSGVAGALRKAAGEELNEAALAAGPVDLGDVAVTGAFGLDAEYVIHAAAMPHYGDGRATETSIRAATRNSLTKADALGCCSVVLPALGTGAAGFPFADGAAYICEEVDSYTTEQIDDLRLIAYAADEFETLQSVAVGYDGYVG